MKLEYLKSYRDFLGEETGPLVPSYLPEYPFRSELLGCTYTSEGIWCLDEDFGADRSNYDLIEEVLP